MRSAIVVDSTAGIDPALLEQPNIFQVDLTINFKDGEIITDTNEPEPTKKFYKKLVESDELPTTSQPELGEYMKIFDQIIEADFDTVFMFLMSSQLSGTYQTAVLAASEYDEKLSIFPIDSKGVSIYTEHVVLEALRMIEAGMSAEEIAAESRWIIDHSTIYVAIKDLNNLVKGGRLNNGQAFIGTMLKVWPILYFKQDGGLGIYDKVRSLKKVQRAYKKIADDHIAKYGEDQSLILFAHGDAEEETIKIRDQILADYSDVSSWMRYLTPVIGVHGGKGCIGMATAVKARI